MSHDLFNASATATWIECSYSARNAVPDAPKKESTIAASEAGTARHDDMEAGEIPDVEAFIAQLENPPSTIREFRVRVADDCGGTIDVFSHGYRNGTNIATIIDGKFGKWDVDAYHNKQMLTYAASLLTSNDAEWWRLVIYQPNGLEEEPWKQWIPHRTEVEAHKQRILRAIADRGPPKPGPQCRWCNAFQSCPAMTTNAGFVMGAMTRPIESLTTSELVRLLRLIRALGDVKEAYEEALTTHLKMGRTAEGAVLKPGRRFRAWNDDMQAADYLTQQFGLKGVKPVSPAQAEKLGVAGKTYAAVGVGSHKPEAPMKASY